MSHPQISQRATHDARSPGYNPIQSWKFKAVHLPPTLNPLDRFRSWLFVRSGTAPFLLTVAFFFFLRVGFSGNNAVPVGVVKTFPTPTTGSFSWSIISPAIGRVLGITTKAQWLALHGVLLLLVFAAVVLLLRQKLTQRSWRVALTWLSLSSAPAANLQWIGLYDLWMLLGGALVGLGSGLPTAVVGGLVLGASNAEQGVVALLSLGFVLLAKLRGEGRQSEWKMMVLRLSAALFGLVVARIAISLWFTASGVEVTTRSGIFLGVLSDSLRNNITMGTTGIFGWFGLAWIAVILCLWGIRQDRLGVGLVSIGLIGLPALVTITTLDGTRVFASISWPALLAMIVWRVTAEEALPRNEQLLDQTASTALLASPIAPSIVTHPRNYLQTPWSYVTGRFFS